MQDVEFTVEEGRLYLLQTRVAKRPAQASVRFACDAVEEGMLDARRGAGDDRRRCARRAAAPDLRPGGRVRGARPRRARLAGRRPGSDRLHAPMRPSAGRPTATDVILVRQFTEADDVAGFHAARGILTAEGGKASHAALVARGMGRPCVAGASALEVDAAAGVVRVGEIELRAGDTIAIDGSSGLVTRDDVPLITPGSGPSSSACSSWADEIRRLGVRANADAPEDAARARSFGAEGIGLCRTEHMFFGEDREELVREMFIAGERWRRARTGDEARGEDASAGENAFRDALGRLGSCSGPTSSPSSRRCRGFR